MEILECIGKKEGKGSRVFYRVKCHECAKDPELFGDAIYEVDRCGIRKEWWKCGCSKRPQWTPEQYKIRIRRKLPDIEIISKTGIEVTCYCRKHNYTWETDTKHLLSGRSCAKCCYDRRSVRKTEKNPIEKVKSLCDKIGYKFHGFVNEYVKSASTYIDVECDKGHRYVTCTMSNFVNGRRCPVCGEHGFDSTKPASFYLFKWKDDTGTEFIKYGITNRDVTKTRIMSQNRNTKFKPEKIAILNFTNGSDAAMLERVCHDYRNANIGTRGFIDKESFPDGYTETLPVSSIDDLKRIVLENTGVNLR